MMADAATALERVTRVPGVRGALVDRGDRRAGRGGAADGRHRRPGRRGARGESGRGAWAARPGSAGLRSAGLRPAPGRARAACSRRPGGDDLVLVAVVGPDANLGLARLEMLDAAGRLGLMRALEPWVVPPLQTFLAESRGAAHLLMTSSGQVVAQHGFTRSLDVMTAAALGAAIVASTEELARLMGALAVRGRWCTTGSRQSCLLSAFATPRGRWIGLVVFGPETSVGIVQLFFDQMVAASWPRRRRGSSRRAPMLAENFEHELNASLKALFGR